LRWGSLAGRCLGLARHAMLYLAPCSAQALPRLDRCLRTLFNLARLALDWQAIMSALRLQLLGPPLAWRDEQPLAFKTRKTFALLAYFAPEGGLHPRDQLAALLWPDHGEAKVALRALGAVGRS